MPPNERPALELRTHVSDCVLRPFARPLHKLARPSEVDVLPRSQDSGERRTAPPVGAPMPMAAARGRLVSGKTHRGFIFESSPTDTQGKSIAMAARARRHHAESLLERDADDVAAKIATSQVKAKAWVSMVVLEMQRGRTVTFREKWFGGAGSQSAADVRDRVMRTMNFLERELMDGLRFVYPANDAENSACGAKTVGYVWKRAPEDGAAYSETQAPQCDSVDEAFSKARPKPAEVGVNRAHL